LGPAWADGWWARGAQEEGAFLLGENEGRKPVGVGVFVCLGQKSSNFGKKHAYTEAHAGGVSGVIALRNRSTSCIVGAMEANGPGCLLPTAYSALRCKSAIIWGSLCVGPS